MDTGRRADRRRARAGGRTAAGRAGRLHGPRPRHRGRRGAAGRRAPGRRAARRVAGPAGGAAAARPGRAGPRADQEVQGRRRDRRRGRRCGSCAGCSARRRCRPRSPWSGRSRRTSTWRTWPSRSTGSAGSPTARRSAAGWPRRSTAVAGEVGPDGLTEALAALAVRPVFTAHPTEASRRTILDELRAVGDVLLAEPAGRSPSPTARRRNDRRLATVVDLIWQTDELRVDRPDPVEEARNVTYYLDDLEAGTVPRLLTDLADEAAAHGARLDPAVPAADLRHLDRRRPGRQPQRHRRGHRAGAAAACTGTASTCCCGRSTGSSASCPPRPGSSGSPPSWRTRWSGTWPPCAGWTSGPAAATPRSRTG